MIDQTKSGKSGFFYGTCPQFGVYNKKETVMDMEEKMEIILDTYYNYDRPEIKELQVLSESPQFGLVTVRWKETQKTVTVKAHFGDTVSIVELT
jgi:hypothetical protein